MKAKISVLLIFFLLIASLVYAKEREGVITFKINLPFKSESKRARLWLPYPLSDEYQSIDNITVGGNFNNSAVYREAKSEATYLFAEWNDISEKMELTMSFKVKAKERILKDFKQTKASVPKEVKKYLESSCRVPTDEKIKEIANQITNNKQGILEKSRAIYNWVVENIYRDPEVRGCGLGIVEKTLAKRGGKCADISSVYVAIARAAGVPARKVFGLRLGKKSKEDMTNGHHCWAEFYLPGTGWIQVDPADVRKVMLVRKLDLKEAEPYREYFFGAVDEYRIVLERGGKGINLYPSQEGEALNYFMYPYAEVDGRPLDYFDPKNFSYSVEFKAL